MALLKYLKVKKKLHEDCLPDPEGPLSGYLSSDAVREEVSSLVLKEASKRMPYLKATPEQRATTGKYAAENGIVNSIKHFQKNFLTDTLKESTVRSW